MHSNLKVASALKEKWMLIMWIINIPDIFLVQQCCIRQIYLGSLHQYRIRRTIFISKQCISDKYAHKSARHFPSGHKIMWNLMCATYLWIHRSIDWLIEWVSEWVSNYDVTAWPSDYHWNQTHFILYSVIIWVSHDISSQDIHSRFIKADL